MKNFMDKLKENLGCTIIFIVFSLPGVLVGILVPYIGYWLGFVTEVTKYDIRYSIFIFVIFWWFLIIFRDKK